MSVVLLLSLWVQAVAVGVPSDSDALRCHANWYCAQVRMSSSSPSASAEKPRLSRALAGDRAAIEQLVDELTPVIQARVARTLLRGRTSKDGLRHEVEDLTQEVFVSLFANGGRNLKAWEPDGGLSLKNFVGLLAQRRVQNILRSRKLSPFANEPTDPSDMEDLPRPVTGVEEQAEARQALERIALELKERLSPKGLEMFYRLFVWQQSPELIAEQTGLKADAIYQWRSRLRKTTAELSQELGGIQPTTVG